MVGPLVAVGSALGGVAVGVTAEWLRRKWNGDITVNPNKDGCTAVLSDVRLERIKRREEALASIDKALEKADKASADEKFKLEKERGEVKKALALHRDVLAAEGKHDEPKAEVKAVEAKPEVKVEAKPEVKVEAKPEVKVEAKAEPELKYVEAPKPKAEANLQEQVKLAETRLAAAKAEKEAAEARILAAKVEKEAKGVIPDDAPNIIAERAAKAHPAAELVS